ncbi:ATPase [Deinococcus sp. Arct2-2]|uniref:N-acetylglucosamine kinase n=1 Tax=Deinococcus sp. Arct2-2 TaxID=2568653 RepID=UPI0010A46AE1|nr:BadF/BadG/BcrA/BcrD ATPase family protein [Deinococcus sp. Arct2-2]THF71767.1 ATPase [Deinococcus sp. Arct2-2]
MTRSPLLLGLDAGGSGTKWVLVRGGVTVASGMTPPLTAALLATEVGAANLAALAAALPGHPDALHAGMPGLSTNSARAAEVKVLLATALNMSPERVGVEGDLDLAYRAHLRPGAGILVYAGTGSIAYHVAENGAVVRAGGRGFLLGDEGGGFSIGRAALRLLTDALDSGRVPDTVLARELAAITGGLDWHSLRAFAYAAPGASAIARLAPAVGRAADGGDADALAILDASAAALAELARRVRARVGTLPVTVTGGALRVSPLFSALLTRALPGAVVQQRNHAEAAARTAAVLAGE